MGASEVGGEDVCVKILGEHFLWLAKGMCQTSMFVDKMKETSFAASHRQPRSHTHTKRILLGINDILLPLYDKRSMLYMHIRPTGALCYLRERES